MHPAGRTLVPSILGGLTGVISTLIAPPSWLTFAGLGSIALGLAVVAVQSVFPQESADRLQWWRDHWHHQHLRRQITIRDRILNRRRENHSANQPVRTTTPATTNDSPYGQIATPTDDSSPT